ncbi:class I SAM-dependent methyltransferase [Marinoscillum sp.]|uniref:class I SAM-dependent methyltransferase n=1 Tax=Marinoscillum sp. TaxID=2024838 RepID=UPI003BA8926F
MKDLHGKAILDYYKGNDEATLILHNSYGDPDEMPVEVFFREEEDLTTLEHLALIESKGRVLDLGAGAGAHALVLQSRGFEVFALENSPGCVDVMRRSGVRNVLFEDFRKHKGQYDTVLILMNGMGLAGTLVQVEGFLQTCEKLLSPRGQILVDSSDISYLYEDGTPKPKGYFGEVRYRYEFQETQGEWFDWLYVDQRMLAEKVSAVGMELEILMTDENDQYLACITRSGT